MKICDSWLREWFEHGLEIDALAHRLTMLGLEVESVARVAHCLERLVVGRVLEVRGHPNAEKLSLCQVDVGDGDPLAIVCGARNVRPGGCYPTALVGARLPGGTTIKATTIRGEPSTGMLCAAAELGLEGHGEGLLELDPGAQPGAAVSQILRLDDHVLEVNVTPNRADCLSVVGLAREVAGAAGIGLETPSIPAVTVAVGDVFRVSVDSAADCPRFAGRVIRGIRANATTPLWMRERLRRCGVRPLHPVVDVTNYVMLELGQPMHAYDIHRVKGEIRVRRGLAGERLRLLDGRDVVIDPEVLAISDDSGAIGLAGVMGGESTAVVAETTDIFLESAFFRPATIAGRARQFGLSTDASTRFERGVDPDGQVRAIERATALIMTISGGNPGPVTEVLQRESLPARAPLRLRRARLAHVLGASIRDGDIGRILRNLGAEVSLVPEGWVATPPAARFDLEREEDLIEEVARVHGYDRIEPVPERTLARPGPIGGTMDMRGDIAALLVARGYEQAITFSFVDPELGRRLGAEEGPQLTLTNPISADLSVMRQSLWPGLVRVARDNLNRQQTRVRIFEVGTRFIPRGSAENDEELCVGILLTGPRLPEQWGAGSEPADFFDLKGDVEAVLHLMGVLSDMRFERASHRALHPGRCARIVDGRRETVGWVGELHPAVSRDIDMPTAMVAELRLDLLAGRSTPVYRPISRFPAVRRDLAVLVPRGTEISTLMATIQAHAPGILQQAFVFDIYTGKQVGEAEKSVAIGLILQDTSRTLTDEDADRAVQAIRGALQRDLRAKIRE